MSLAGNWETVMKTPMGPQKGKMSFAEAGGVVTGFSEGANGHSDFQDLKVDGNKFSFWFETKSPMGLVKVSFEGTYDGDTLAADCKTPFGPAKMTGKRLS